MAAPGIFVWGLGDATPQVGLRPDMGSGGRSLQILFTSFDCRNDQNLKILHNSPLILNQDVSLWG